MPLGGWVVTIVLLLFSVEPGSPFVIPLGAPRHGPTNTVRESDRQEGMVCVRRSVLMDSCGAAFCLSTSLQRYTMGLSGALVA